MNIHKKMTSIVLSAALALPVYHAVRFNDRDTMTAKAASNTIVNDTFWKDTSGKYIYSQGGGVFKFGDTYYWYGVHYKGAETYAANPSKKNSDTGFVSVT